MMETLEQQEVIDSLERKLLEARLEKAEKQRIAFNDSAEMLKTASSFINDVNTHSNKAEDLTKAIDILNRLTKAYCSWVNAVAAERDGDMSEANKSKIKTFSNAIKSEQLAIVKTISSL